MSIVAGLGLAGGAATAPPTAPRMGQPQINGTSVENTGGYNNNSWRDHAPNI